MIGECVTPAMRRLGPVYRAVLVEVAPAAEARVWVALRQRMSRAEFATAIHFEVVDRCDR